MHNIQMVDHYNLLLHLFVLYLCYLSVHFLLINKQKTGQIGSKTCSSISKSLVKTYYAFEWKNLEKL